MAEIQWQAAEVVMRFLSGGELVRSPRPPAALT
jgi:hypothetical protein